MAPTEGYWGEVTSTLDWCEDNYVISPYIAEFWNTISNVPMIFPPLFIALINVGSGIEKRIMCCFIGIVGPVGIGSWCFHMTLRYSMQLLDELPMLYGSAFLLYAFIDIEKPLHSKNRPLEIFLIVYCIVSTWIYLFVQDPRFHQTAYGLMVVGTVLSCLKALVNRGNVMNTTLAWTSLALYTTGFVAWNIDNNFCPHLKDLRSQLHTTGFLTQLHAWWHILAGIGTYLCLVLVIDTRYRIVPLWGKLPRLKYFMGVFPYTVIEAKRKSNIYSNGAASHKRL